MDQAEFRVEKSGNYPGRWFVMVYRDGVYLHRLTRGLEIVRLANDKEYMEAGAYFDSKEEAKKAVEDFAEKRERRTSTRAGSG